MFDFHHEARAHSTKPTYHSFGVEGLPSAPRSINISLLAELCVTPLISTEWATSVQNSGRSIFLSNKRRARCLKSSLQFGI